MAAFAPAYVQVQPSLFLPETIIQYQQPSGAFETIATGNPMTRLGEGDLAVYMKKLALTTQVAAGQSAGNQLPSCALVPTQISTPTYLLRVRAEYDHHDQHAASNWNIALPEAYRLAMRQGHFQQARNALLYGMNPALGEGLLNTAGATTVSLPADSFGNTTISTYDNGQAAIFILQQIAASKTRMFQIGMPAKVVILLPQRVLALWSYQAIVQLTSVQRAGGGSLTTRTTVDWNAEENDDEVMFVCDDTLIGKGAGGTDAILIVIPEIKKPVVQNARVNTNEFAKLANGLDACTMQFCDMAAPREISAPLPAGATDVVSEWRITSGWGVRPESVTVVSAQFS